MSGSTTGEEVDWIAVREMRAGRMKVRDAKTRRGAVAEPVCECD